MAGDPPKLATLYDINLRDVPGMLRKLLSDIEKNEYGQVHACVLVLDTDRGIVPIGLGDADALRAVGLLTAGAIVIVQQRSEH